MMMILLFLMLLLGSPPPAPRLTSPRLPPCVSGRTHHQRWPMKTRTLLYEDESPTVVTIADILATDIPSVVPVDADNQPVNRIEQTFYHIELAAVCLVKQSRDDCDVHAELAATPVDCLTGGPRVIVELPANAGKEAQETLLDAVGLARLGTAPHVFKAPPLVQVFGWGFYDFSHRCATDPKGGCQHGTALVATLLELHPARIEAKP